MLVSFGPLVPLVGARVAFGRSVDPAGTMSGRGAGDRRPRVVHSCAGGDGGRLHRRDRGEPAHHARPTRVGRLAAPALALSAISVAVATYVDSTVPTISFGIAWLAAVGAWLGDVPRALRGLSVDGLVTDRPAVQAALVVAIAAAVVVCVARRDSDPNWRTLP